MARRGNRGHSILRSDRSAPAQPQRRGALGVQQQRRLRSISFAALVPDGSGPDSILTPRVAGGLHAVLGMAGANSLSDFWFALGRFALVRFAQTLRQPRRLHRAYVV